MIDPSIALHVKPPQVTDPLEQAGRAMNLLAAREQIQTAPLRREAMQQELEQGRLVAEKTRTAIDEEKAFKEALGRGAKAMELFGIAPTLARAHVTAEIAQRKSVLESAKQQAQMFGNALGSVKYAAPEKQAEQYAVVRANAIQQGIIKAEDAPEQYDPAFVDQHFRATIDADKQIDDHQKELEFQQRVLSEAPKTAKEWNDLVLREGSAAKSQAELDQTRARLEALGVPKQMLSRTLPAMWSETAMNELATRAMTPEQRAQAKTAQQNADTARLNAENNVTEAELAYRAKHDPDPQKRADAEAALKRLDQSRRESRPVTNVNLPGLPGQGGAKVTGAEFLKTLGTGLAAQVKAIAEGRAVIPSGSSRSPAAVQLRDAVFSYDPTFSEQRAQVRRAFTTGNDGRNIGALNTAVVHLGRLGDTAEALKNGSFTPGNELFNYFKDKFGSNVVTNFELLKDAVAGEMAAALKGNATDIEIANMKKSIRAVNSPEQMRGVVVEGMNILTDKANTYDERYHQQMPDDPWSPVLPSAKQALAKYGAGGKHGATQQGGAAPGNGGVVKWTRDAQGRPVPQR